MLLKDRRGRQRGLEAVRRSRPDDSAEAAQRLTAALDVVGKGVEPALDRGWRSQSRDEPPLDGCERLRRRGRVAQRPDRQCWLDGPLRGPSPISAWKWKPF